MLAPGCSTVDGQSKLDPAKVGLIVEDASFIGTRVALLKNPEWRPEFEKAVTALEILEADPNITLSKVVTIAQTLHVKELKSDTALLAITGAELVLVHLDRGTIDLSKTEVLLPAVIGFRRGIQRGLGQFEPTP